MAKTKKMASDEVLKLIIAVLLLAMIPLTYYAMKYFQSPVADAAPTIQTGNGAPKGAHFNLNVHGKPKTFTYTETSNDGHSLFIPLFGKASISLIQGPSFQVLDANATDGKGSFQLPNPDPENDGITTYSVWVRPLAKPGGKLTTVPCANVPTYDPITGVQTGSEYLCSTENVVTVRNTGKSKFTDVSSQLLYLYLDLNGDGVTERYPLFDPIFQGTFWDMTNDGSRLFQMRFYPLSVNVN